MKKEAQFTGMFRRWAMRQTSAAWEIKHTRGKDLFSMRELKEHQLDALLAVMGPHGFAYKIPDDGLAYKPFDMVSFFKAKAWVVICYPTYFCVMSPVVMRRLKDAKKTSLSFKDASRLAEAVVPLKEL